MRKRIPILLSLLVVRGSGFTRPIPLRNSHPRRGVATFTTKASSTEMSAAEAFDATVYARRACSRFQRFDGTKPSYDDYTPSQSNETVVNLAFESLDLARRAPTGFNTQPYKLVLVHSPDLKKKVSDYCAGANGFRVCDSDCTAVFLADREVVRTMGKFGRFLRKANPKQALLPFRIP